MKQLKFILCLVLLACLAFGNAFAADSLPYDCYNYDHWNNILYTPAPYCGPGAGPEDGPADHHRL